MQNSRWLFLWEVVSNGYLSLTSDSEWTMWENYGEIDNYRLDIHKHPKQIMYVCCIWTRDIEKIKVKINGQTKPLGSVYSVSIYIILFIDQMENAQLKDNLL